MNLKEYQPMQVQELGSLASLTQGMNGIYPDNMGQTMMNSMGMGMQDD